MTFANGGDNVGVYLPLFAVATATTILETGNLLRASGLVDWRILHHAESKIYRKAACRLWRAHRPLAVDWSRPLSTARYYPVPFVSKDADCDNVAPATVLLTALAETYPGTGAMTSLPPTMCKWASL